MLREATLAQGEQWEERVDVERLGYPMMEALRVMTYFRLAFQHVVGQRLF